MYELVVILALFVAENTATAGGVHCEYEIVRKFAMYGLNTKVMKSSDVESCKEACDEMGNACASLDFNSYTGSCFLSDQNRASEPDMFGPHAKMDYYEKMDCTEDSGSNVGEWPDSDKCPSGYIYFKGFQGGHCYRFNYQSNLNWFAAREECKSEEADLVSITSQYEMDFLVEMIKKILADAGQSSDHELWWVGAIKDEDDPYANNMHWLDGTVLVKDNPLWYYGEPNGYGAERAINLLIMDDMSGINDLSAYEHIRFICERYRIDVDFNVDSEEYQDSDEWYGSGSGSGYPYEF